MRTISTSNTYYIQEDESGNTVGGSYVGGNVAIITNDDKIKVNDLSSDQVDWAIIDAAEKGIGDNDILVLESEPRTSASDNSVEKLVNNGVTLITVE